MDTRVAAVPGMGGDAVLHVAGKCSMFDVLSPVIHVHCGAKLVTGWVHLLVTGGGRHWGAPHVQSHTRVHI